jgi:hypothetical protein
VPISAQENHRNYTNLNGTDTLMAQIVLSTPCLGFQPKLMPNISSADPRELDPHSPLSHFDEQLPLSTKWPTPPSPVQAAAAHR